VSRVACAAVLERVSNVLVSPVTRVSDPFGVFGRNRRRSSSLQAHQEIEGA